MPREIDVLVPTCDRPAPLAVTLATLVGQTFRDFRVVISDQTGAEGTGADARVVQAVLEVLRFQGVPVEVHENLPRRGVAHQRGFLFERVEAPYALFLDDDVILEADALETMHGAIAEEECGFVGCFVASPKYLDAEKLRDVGGFDFWTELPEEHVGEDAVAQVRLMEAHGGCGLLPTRAYHQVVGTTMANRDVDAPEELL